MSGSSVQVFEYLLALKNIMVPAVRGLQDNVSFLLMRDEGDHNENR